MVSGAWLDIIPKDRISCVLVLLWIIIPAHKNSNALNRAWVYKWKSDSWTIFIPNLIIITPNCLSVDKAMIFFKSFSRFAAIPAMRRVRTEMNRMEGLNVWVLDKNGKKRIKRNTPAVTSVDEWTSADTGVGAAIAAGSQAEKGIWALLVIPAIVIVKTIHLDKWKSHIWIIIQWPWSNIIPIEIKIITSPMRLAKIVSIPAASDFAFW